tara:strand:+ start:5956 stop:6237 length:282 start_codon:yes stop_codon:yes gene_type:complete
LSKPKLIKQLKEKYPSLTKSEIEILINSFLESIVLALKEGRTIEIRHFGRFYCKKLKENFKARNPKTNELIYKPERVRLKFKASKKLNRLINE